MLELLTSASASFSEWIAALRGPGLRGSVDASSIIELARRARAGGEPEAVTVGTVTVSRGLYDIYTNEAAEHIAVLEAQCKAWRAAQPAEASPDFMRAAHTLSSTSRTAGFAPLADLSGALEQWTGFAGETTDPQDADTVQAAVTSLRGMVESIQRGEAPASPQPQQTALRALITRLEARAPRRGDAAGGAPARRTRKARHARRHRRAAAADLPRGGAAAACREIGADLREWKANPADEKIRSRCASLHTLKGSARMAGAIRLGELTHLMESRIEAALEAGQYTDELFDRPRGADGPPEPDVERMRSHEVTVVVAPPAVPAAAAPQTAAAPAAAPAPRAEPPLPSAAAMLRVNADTLDHLINESGEVAIARSRVEAELRAIKQSLGDLSKASCACAASCARSRSRPTARCSRACR